VSAISGVCRLSPITSITLSFHEWINSIDSYKGADLCYLQQGRITEGAIIRKGEKRTAPFRENRRFDANNFHRGAGPTQDVEEEEDEVIDSAKLQEMEG
jgi:tRNA pseudouridine38-40 synthase